MKYIVTGGAGFLGSNLVDHLISEGNEVHIFDNFSTGKEENCNKKGIYHKLDISDSVRLVDAIISEGSKFAESILAPLHQIGDKEGCKFDNGIVTTPPGFKEAYAKYVAGGWPSLAGDPEYGGQGLPGSLSVVINELVSTANWAWEMYPGLSQGAKLTLAAYGTEAQKQT